MIGPATFQKSIEMFLAPVAAFFRDDSVSEIMINGPDEIWVERRGRLNRTDARFPGTDALSAALTNIAQFNGRPLDPSRPILEAHLPDGSRVEAILPPIADGGPIVSIRRFSRSTLTIDRLVASDSLSAEGAAFLKDCVESKRNIVVSGGTGTGKTSLLGALSSYIDDDERIVVIEDTREVQLQKPHVVYLEARAPDEKGRGAVPIRRLLSATLRLRPDRIVVGECRGPEALDLIQAMTSGHGGSLTTTHATSPGDALRRLETMALTANSGLPLTALRSQLASAIDVIVQVVRGRDGRRQVSSIARAEGLDPRGDYALRPLFARNPDGQLISTDKGDVKWTT